MRMKLITALTIAALLPACAQLDINPEKIPQTAAMPDIKKTAPDVRSYVRISSPKHQILSQRTRVNRKAISIADALLAPKGLEQVQIIAKDRAVDLKKIISLRVVDMTIKDYLANLGSITNYDYVLDVSGSTPVIAVSSMVIKEWNLAPMSHMPEAEINAGFSATLSSTSDEDEEDDDGSSKSGASLKIKRTNDTWAETIKQAKTILDIDEDDEDDENNINIAGGLLGSDSLTIPDLIAGGSAIGLNGDSSLGRGDIAQDAWLVANRRLGTITAYGRPNDINRLDQWLSKTEKNLTRQIFLDVAILDVTSSKGDGRGIDWSAVYNNSGFTTGDTGVGSIGLSGNNRNAFSLVDGGTWALTTAGKVGSVTLSALITALSEEGSVKIQSEPKLNVTNGYTAYLGSTEEFSYVSDIEILPVGSSDGGSSDSIVTTNLSRVSVGLKLAVTPRILKNDDILLEVVPIISSIKGFTEINNGGQVISTPNIAIQELATQVITKSGKPVHLGGLILSRIIENAKRVPLPGGEASRLISELLGSVKVEEEGRELLIVITPTEVGS